MNVNLISLPTKNQIINKIQLYILVLMRNEMV